MNTIRISPSLLAADFANLEREIKRAEDAGADMLHLDIMDGHFVPNLTMGPPLVASIRKISSMYFDVHLMVDNAHEFLKPFADAGADCLGIHLEVYPDPTEVLGQIKELGKDRCLVINPDMPVAKIAPFLDHVERVLIMSVFPGFGGQSFIEESIERLQEARALIGEREIDLQVDGGVKIENAGRIIGAGATNLVVGTGSFRAPDMKAAIEQIRTAG